MIAVITLVSVAAFLFAGGFARARYGELRVSELPVLLLALLAGSGERERLRAILRNRDMPGAPPAGPSATMPPAGPAPRPRPARCYCNWCRGRAGVHDAEAKALYRAEVAAVMAQADERRPNLRWERPS